MAVYSVLKTPLEIFQIFSKQFPLGQASIDVNEVGIITLKLQSSQNSDPLFLQNTVIERLFTSELTELFQRIQVASMTRTAVQPIEVSRFSTRTHLSDWQSFRRVMYERSGNSCLNAILAVLQNPQDFAVLIHLGLAPEQVEKDCTESDFSYFKELPKRWKEMSHETKTASFHNFQRFYPQISQRLLSHMVDRDRVSRSESGPYDRVLKELSMHVIGQDWAKERVAAALVSPQSDNKVFLLVGPTGVGKTELALACGSLKNNRFVCFNMEKFSKEDAITQFFGSTTGYKGSGDKPCFIKAMDQFNPQKTSQIGSNLCYEVREIVLLLDEFEKAHYLLKDSLLTLLEKGYCSFSITVSGLFEPDQNLNYRYEFKNCVIACTSNLFDEEILAEFNRGQTPEQISESFKLWNRLYPSERSYSQPLLGRVYVIPFGPIPRGNCYQSIIRTQLEAYMKTFKTDSGCREFCLENEAQVLSVLEKHLYKRGVNLRSIKDFFKFTVSSIIYKETKTFGNMSNKKLTLLCNGESLIIKLSTFLEDIGEYTDIGNIMFRLV